VLDVSGSYDFPKRKFVCQISSPGAGASIREEMVDELLVEDQGEIHDFEGNHNN